MSNKRTFRGGRQHDSRDDRVDYNARRASAEGRPHNDHRHTATTAGEQLYGDEDIKSACRAILAEQLGTYHLFGAAFAVERHNTKDFVLVKYVGALPDCALNKAQVRVGTFVPLNKFFAFWRKPDETEFSVEDASIVVNYIMAQAVMQEAMTAHLAERQADRQIGTASARAEILGAFKKVIPETPQPVPPALTSIGDLMTATWGTFQHASGVTLLVCYGKEYRGNRPIVLRAKDAADGHELAEIAEEGIFVNQAHIGLAEKEHAVEGKAALARAFREWLRKEMREAGVIFEPAVNTMAVVNAEHENDLGDTHLMLGDTVTGADAVSMAAVDAEHEQELQQQAPVRVGRGGRRLKMVSSN